jgi:FKBP-type peptidyl-prolyl cis-trans isomerase SlyD
MGDTMSVIAENKVGIFHYTLTNQGGEVLDSSQGQDPMPYLHGAGNIIPGLEKEMDGKEAGAKFTAVISPENAYGEFNPEAFIQVPKDQLPEGIEFQKGLQLLAQDEDGGVMPIFMDGYDSDTDIFTFNCNHPLAGETLTFEVEVFAVRDATETELTQGHPEGLE